MQCCKANANTRISAFLINLFMFSMIITNIRCHGSGSLSDCGLKDGINDALEKSTYVEKVKGGGVKGMNFL